MIKYNEKISGRHNMEDRHKIFRDSDGTEYSTRDSAHCSFEPPEDYSPASDETPPPFCGNTEKVRSSFSSLHLALVAFVLISQAVGTVLQVLAMIILPEEMMAREDILGYLTMAINVVAMYLTAFPVFLYMTKKIPKASAVSGDRMTGGEFATLFVIAQGAMLGGAIIGNIFNSIVNIITGVMPENNLDTIINAIPLWLTFLVVVVIGPIIEEIVFRKVMIDRLSVVGEGWAILFSSIAFGLFHGNLYQLFYATLVGLIFGYVYTRTRDIRYSIALHMLINFAGSILPTAIAKLSEALPEDAVMAITLGYAALQYAFLLFGAIAGVFYFLKGGFKLRNERDIQLLEGEGLKTVLRNPGVTAFYLLSLAIMVTTIISEVLTYYAA